MRFGLSTFLLVRVYEDSRRAQFAHGQESVQGVPLSLRSALALFVWPCEVRALFLPIPRSGLERDCCSRLEPFWRVRVFFLRWRCMLRTDVAGCLKPFAGALPRPTLISRPIRRTNRCVKLYGSKTLCFKCTIAYYHMQSA